MPAVCFGTATGGLRTIGRGQLLRPGAALDRAADLRGVDLAFADRLVERFGVRQVELADQLRQRDGVDRQALQLAFQDLLALLPVLVLVELAEPGAHLAAVARRDQVAERRARASRGSD